MGEKKLRVEGMSCGNCEKSVVSAIRSVPNVTDANASAEQGEVVVRFEQPPDWTAVRQAIEDQGFDVV